MVQRQPEHGKLRVYFNNRREHDAIETPAGYLREQVVLHSGGEFPTDVDQRATGFVEFLRDWSSVLTGATTVAGLKSFLREYLDLA